MKKYSRQLPAAKAEDKINFKKLTSKQLAIYYWFVSKSYWNSFKKEDHYYIYYSDINYSQIARELGIGSTNTVRSAISKLLEKDLLWKDDDKECYQIPIKSCSTYMDICLIRFLLSYSTVLGGEIILFYSVLKKCFESSNGNYRFSITEMVKGLGHNKTDDGCYKLFRIYLSFFKEFDLIDIKEQTAIKQGSTYVQYVLCRINDGISKKCSYIDDDTMPEVDKDILDKVTKDIY